MSIGIIIKDLRDAGLRVMSNKPLNLKKLVQIPQKVQTNLKQIKNRPNSPHFPSQSFKSPTTNTAHP